MGQRNLNLTSGGRRILGSPFNGVLAEDVPATGDHGPAILYPMIVPGDYGSRVSLRITSVPGGVTLGGNVIVREDSSVYTDGTLPAGVYAFGFQAKFEGANIGSPQTYTLTIGGLAGSATVSNTATGGLSAGPASLGGAGSGSGQAAGNLTGGQPGGQPGATLGGNAQATGQGAGSLSTTAALGGQGTGTGTGYGHPGAQGASLGGNAVGGGSAFGGVIPGPLSDEAKALTTPSWPFRRYKTTIRRTH